MFTVSISALKRLTCGLTLGMAVCAPGMAAKQVLVVFPVDKPENVEQSVADTVQSGLRSRVEASGRYDATTFYAKSPLVTRAAAGGAITEAQMAGPYTQESASAIARAIGADVALIASVEDASVDAAANKATVTISAQIISATDGKALKTSGTSGEVVKAATPAGALLRLAADNAAGKAASQLFAGSVASVGKTQGGTPANAVAAQPPAKKKSKKSQTGLLVGGLVLIGVIVASSHHGGGSSSGGNGGPPPLPF